MQPVVEPALVVELSDTSATITWTPAAGDVAQYTIMYTNIAAGIDFTANVSGSVTTFTLTGLEPVSGYRVVILTVNSDGDSATSPVTTFTTFGTYMLSSRKLLLESL